MLDGLEVTNVIGHKKKLSFKHERVLTAHNGQGWVGQQKTRRPIPVKEYSNKFLRSQENFKENRCKGDMKVREKQDSRGNVLVKKHKVMQHRLANPLQRQHCLTQPSQTPHYQCFMTSSHFMPVQHQPPVKSRVRTEPTQQIQLQRPQTQSHMTSEQQRPQLVQKEENSSFTPNNDKISTSRALEMYSKLISKDNRDLAECIRLSHPRHTQERLQGSKHIEAKQATIFKKVAKPSSWKGNSRPRRRTVSSLRFGQLCPQDDDSFKLEGWEREQSVRVCFL